MKAPPPLLAALLVLFVPSAPGLRAQEPVRSRMEAQEPEHQADDSLGLSLDEALQRAAGRSQEIRLARAEVDLARAQVTAARSVVLPQIDASLNYTRTFDTPFRAEAAPTPDSLRFSPDSTASVADRLRYLEENAHLAALGGFGSLFGNLPFGQVNSYVAAITATQPIYAAGRIGAALTIANEYRASAELALQESVSGIELDVRTAYVNAQLAQQLETIAAAALAQAESFLAEERLRLQTGTVSELDLLRAEVAVENLRPPLVEAGNAASVATLELKRLVDLPAAQPLRLTTALVAPSDETIARDLVTVDDRLADRAAIRISERQVTIREQQVRIARAAHLPTVDLRVNYGRQAFPSRVFDFGGVDWRPDFTAVVGVSVPIFSGFRASAETQQARVALEQERLRLVQQRERVFIEYEQARGERERAAASLAARQRTVAQASRVHELTILRYDEGLATQLEVSDARLALLQSRTSLAQAIADFHLAEALIARALGESTIAVGGTP